MAAKRYWEALHEVVDPEFPISVVDLGLIYGIEERGEGTLRVKLTYTSVACACMQWIEEDIRERLLHEPGVREVTVDVVWDPPWTVSRLSERGRRIFQQWGLSV